jgi:hypothetical protein
MSVHSLRNAACLGPFFVAAALLAACQGNIGTGSSGLPAAPGQGVAPNQAGAAGSQSRQRVVEGAVYLTPGMAEIPLPALGSFSVTIDLGSPAPVASGASASAPSPGASGAQTRTSRASRGSDLAAMASAPAAVLNTPSVALTAAAGTVAPGSSASPASGENASSAPSSAASASATGKAGRATSGGAVPSPTPSGPKIDTKLTVYPEDAPAAPTPAPTGNVQTYLKRVALVRGYLQAHADLTLSGLGAVHFTIPTDEQAANRGFTVAIFDQSKKHHDRLVAWDANAALSGTRISATAQASPIPLKKGVGYAFLLYGDELAPAPAASGGTYPPPGNNPFATPGPGGTAANPYATSVPNNPYATATPYNPYATPSPYNPYVPTIPPAH